jgi:hypothetical protein
MSSIEKFSGSGGMDGQRSAQATPFSGQPTQASRKLPELPGLPTVEEFVKQTTPAAWFQRTLEKWGVSERRQAFLARWSQGILKKLGLGERRSAALQKVDAGLGAYQVNSNRYNQIKQRFEHLARTRADPATLRATADRAEQVYAMALHDHLDLQNSFKAWDRNRKDSGRENHADPEAKARDVPGVINALRVAVQDSASGPDLQPGQSATLPRFQSAELADIDRRYPKAPAETLPQDPGIGPPRRSDSVRSFTYAEPAQKLVRRRGI